MEKLEAENKKLKSQLLYYEVDAHQEVLEMGKAKIKTLKEENEKLKEENEKLMEEWTSPETLCNEYIHKDDVAGVVGEMMDTLGLN